MIEKLTFAGSRSMKALRTGVQSAGNVSKLVGPCGTGWSLFPSNQSSCPSTGTNAMKCEATASCTSVFPSSTAFLCQVMSSLLLWNSFPISEAVTFSLCHSTFFNAKNEPSANLISLQLNSECINAIVPQAFIARCFIKKVPLGTCSIESVLLYSQEALRWASEHGNSRMNARMGFGSMSNAQSYKAITSWIWQRQVSRPSFLRYSLITSGLDSSGFQSCYASMNSYIKLYPHHTIIQMSSLDLLSSRSQPHASPKQSPSPQHSPSQLHSLQHSNQYSPQTPEQLLPRNLHQQRKHRVLRGQKEQGEEREHPAVLQTKLDNTLAMLHDRNRQLSALQEEMNAVKVKLKNVERVNFELQGEKVVSDKQRKEAVGKLIKQKEKVGKLGEQNKRLKRELEQCRQRNELLRHQSKEKMRVFDRQRSQLKKRQKRQQIQEKELQTVETWINTQRNVDQEDLQQELSHARKMLRKKQEEINSKEDIIRQMTEIIKKGKKF